jgi:integrase
VDLTAPDDAWVALRREGLSEHSCAGDGWTESVPDPPPPVLVLPLSDAPPDDWWLQKADLTQVVGPSVSIGTGGDLASMSRLEVDVAPEDGRRELRREGLSEHTGAGDGWTCAVPLPSPPVQGMESTMLDAPPEDCWMQLVPGDHSQQRAAREGQTETPLQGQCIGKRDRNGESQAHMLLLGGMNDPVVAAQAGHSHTEQAVVAGMAEPELDTLISAGLGATGRVRGAPAADSGPVPEPPRVPESQYTLFGAAWDADQSRDADPSRLPCRIMRLPWEIEIDDAFQDITVLPALMEISLLDTSPQPLQEVNDFLSGSDKWALHAQGSDVSDLYTNVCKYIDKGNAESTLKGEKYAWKHWNSFTDSVGTSTWRDDPKVAEGAPAAVRREAFLMAMAMLHIYRRMRPRSNSDPAPKPSSAMKILSHIKRAHLRRGLPFSSLSLASMAMKGLLREYTEVHGSEFLIPNRKEPYSHEEVKQMLTLEALQGEPIDAQSEFWVSWRALVSLLYQSGFRKAEVAVANDRAWGKTNMSRASLTFKIDGKCYSNPSILLLLSMKEGDFVIVAPPPSKADQFGAVWGASPVYLEYICRTGNAACALVNMEIRFPCTMGRRETPLFAVSGQALKHGVLESTLKKVLLTIMSPDKAKTHSYHSFRVTLACALLAAGASEGRIQAICRWQTEKSLSIYARLNDKEYAEWLRRASHADISSARTQNLTVQLCDSEFVAQLDGYTPKEAEF